MERQLQERLIGATVLVTVAVLVVPELLSGPQSAAPASVPATTVNDASSVVAPAMMSAETDSPRAGRPDSVPEVVSSAAPLIALPAAIPPLKGTPVAARSEVSSGRSPAAAPADASKPPQKKAAAQPARAAPPAKRPREEPSLEKPPLDQRAWWVQVGSYSKPATAKRIAKNLQNHGFAAVVLPVDLQGKRLYRVRVGPPADRKTAGQTLERVQRLMPGARLVGNS